MAAKSVSERGFRSSLRLEQLESRVMLSASPSDIDLPPAHEAKARHNDSRPDAVFDLGITGTEIQFSHMGTPSFMAGTISYVAASGHTAHGIGMYQETLTPIFMDVNGDAMPDFVGTNGVATFSFYAGSIFVGSITTVNTSFIQGMTATGELLVGSTGTITGTAGLLRNATGGFTSQSVVALFPTFAMQTAVHFVINDCRLNGHQLAKIAGAIAGSIAEAHQPKLKAKAVEALHAMGDDDKHDDKPEKHGRSHDGDVCAPRSADRLARRAEHHDSWSSRRLDRWSSDLAACRLG